MSAIHQHGNLKLLRKYKFIPPTVTPQQNQTLAYDTPGQKTGELQLKWISLGGFSPTELPLTIPASSANFSSEVEVKFGVFYKAEADAPCRIRAYTSGDARNKDASRTPFVKPGENQGCVFDIILKISDSGILIFSPLAIYAGEKIYLLIDNLAMQALSIKLYFWG